MQIQYEWVFGKFRIAKSENDLINVIKSLNWILIAKSNDCEVNRTGTIELDNPNKNSFVDIKDLTKDLVELWVVGKLSQEKVDNLKNEMLSKLEDKLNSNFEVIEPIYKS